MNYLSRMITPIILDLGHKSTLFLLHNNRIFATEQIIVFTTDNGLKYLTEALT